MARPSFQPLDNLDVGKEAARAVPNVRAEAQLHNQMDVSQAHQFFQTGSSEGLPNLKLTGTESTAGAHAVKGAESLLGHVGTGAEHALGAIAQPGAQQISPLVQLIMKMPGMTGVMSSLFEFLGSLVHGNLLEALNPTTWLEHAGEAIASMQDAVQHFAVSLDMIPANGPMLHFDGQSLMPMEHISGMNLHTDSLSHAADSAANVGAPIEQPNLNNAVFEKAGDGTTVTDYAQNSVLDWRHPQNFLASNTSPESGVFSPTTGAVYQPSASAPAPTPAATPTQSAPAPHAEAAPHHVAHHVHHGAEHKLAMAEHHHVQHSEAAVEQQPDIAQASDAPQSPGGGEYTVGKGDSLWNIARKQLGDGSRWHEIYKLNADTIGNNPDIIQPGAALKMPDGTSIASADHYVVQPGDNLWNIARHHAGGGQNWGDIYKVNHDVIGSNPNMIHPGQELSLNGASGGDAGTIASGSSATPSADQAVDAGHDAGTMAAVSTPQSQSIATAPMDAPQPVAEPVVHHAAPVADHTAVATNYPHSSAPSTASYPHSSAGQVQAETPIMAPVDGAATASQIPAPMPHPGEQTFNSATQVPLDTNNGLPSDGSLFPKRQ